jgi:hypothetical protein
MAHITEEHLHHMAKRHHATMKKLDGIREKVAGHAGRLVGTLETGAGSWLGGAIEGRTAGGTVLRIPINLGIGAILLAVGHMDLAGEGWSNHLNNVGNGFIGSYVAATGYAFGKRWLETGKVFGGGGHPWKSPYEDGGWPHQVEGPAPAPAVHGDLSQAQMDNIVYRMQQAAASPAHP